MNEKTRVCILYGLHTLVFGYFFMLNSYYIKLAMYSFMAGSALQAS